MHGLLVKVGQQLRRARSVPPVPHQVAHHSESGQDVDPSGAHAAVSIICDALALAFRGIGVGIDRVSFLEEREREECGALIRGRVRDSSRHIQIGHTGEIFFVNVRYFKRVPQDASISLISRQRKMSLYRRWGYQGRNNRPAGRYFILSDPISTSRPECHCHWLHHANPPLLHFAQRAPVGYKKGPHGATGNRAPDVVDRIKVESQQLEVGSKSRSMS